MGKFSRDKGYRVENNLRKQILTHENMECIRVPLSGGASIKGDLIFNKIEISANPIFYFHNCVILTPLESI